MNKKRIKKTASKNKAGKKAFEKSPISKTDFETFKFGVERLKELEKELNSLDTRGFAKEDKDIRVKLKKVSEIPVIEKKLKDLRLKINNKFKPKIRKKSPSKEIKKDLDKIKGELERIKRLKKAGKPELDDIQEELKKLRREHKEEIKSNKPDFGKIQEQLKKIEKAHEKDSEAIKKSTARQKIPIDASVGVLVDTKFNNFLSEIKKALSDRIEKKEKEIDLQSEIDLEEREFKYAKRHDDLLLDFKKKFNKKIKEGLAQEISVKFKEKINDRFEQEKARINREYKSELKKHAIIELNNQKQKLEERMKNKVQLFKNQEEGEIKQIKGELIEQAHKKLDTELAKKEKELKAKLENEYDLRMKQKIQDHENELKKRKLDLELEMQKKIKQVLE